MSKTTITLRVDEVHKTALDVLAASQKRDRSFIINEAIENYLEVQQWQIEQIKKACKEADEGKFASDSQVQTFFNQWTYAD